MFRGIDVSHNNGHINWKAVRSTGIDFAMIRAGHGTAEDREFQNNIRGAIANGIDCGAYWFSYAVNRREAVAEANAFLKTVKPYKFTYPLAFDYEYYSLDVAEKRGIKITPAIACDIADGFMSMIAAAKYYIVNYTNADFIRRYFTLPYMRRYENWIAQWTSVKPSIVTGIWQNEVRGSVADVKANPPRASVVGSLSGVTGAIDMDVSYKDYPVLIRKAGLNHLTDAIPKADPVKSVHFQPFKHGDKVRLSAVSSNGNKKYGRTYTGALFRMYSDEYNVIGDPETDRVCIGIGSTITAAVNAKDLEKLNK